MMLIAGDLTDCASTPQRQLWSLQGRHNTWFCGANFGAEHGDGGGGRLLRDRVEDHLRAAGFATDFGAIRLCCVPRVFGYGFNPLSVYFCYQRDGSLAAILYEVHNTSRERHSYLIPLATRGWRAHRGR
jgi:uncharacterized protein